MRRGWRYAIRRARSILEKNWSDEFQAFYYHNKRTDESTWEKPAFLGTQDLAPTPRSHAAAVAAGTEPVNGPLARNGVRLTPRGTNFILGPLKPPPSWLVGEFRQAEQMSEDEAAILIQTAARGNIARRAVRLLVKQVFERVYDVDSSAFYFYNTNTGESSWEEPELIHRMFGHDHTLEETPRDQSLAIRFKARPQRKLPRTSRRAANLDAERASTSLQAAARMWIARVNIVAVVQARIRKCFHARFGAFFYYDTVRHSATWFKPTILRRSEIRETTESELSEEIRRLLPGMANAPDDFAMNAAAPQHGLPMIAELSASEAWRITTARSTASSIAASLPRPMSAVPSWKPNWIDSVPSESELSLTLTAEKLKSLHLRQLRLFALAHHPAIAMQTEELYDLHKENVWSVLAADSQFAASFHEAVLESKQNTLQRLTQAVSAALHGQIAPTARAVEQEVSSASAVAAARRSNNGRGTSLAILAASLRRTEQPKTISDPTKRQGVDSTYARAAKMLPTSTEATGLPDLIAEIDEGNDESKQSTSRSAGSQATSKATFEDALGAAKAFFASLGSRGTQQSDKIQGSLLGKNASSVLKMTCNAEASTPRPAKSEADAMAQGSNKSLSEGTSRKAAFERVEEEIAEGNRANPPNLDVLERREAVLAKANAEFGALNRSKHIIGRKASPPVNLSRQLEQPSSKVSQSSQLTQTLRSYSSALDVTTSILEFEQVVKRWSRRFDRDQGRFFYLNNGSGATSWDRPAEILEFAIPLSPRTQMAYDVFERNRVVGGLDRRKKAEHMSPAEAAIIIQCAFRGVQAFKLAKWKARRVYKKAFDETTGGTYYWNPRTERSAWIKPRLLGSDDVKMTPRSRMPDAGIANPDGSKPIVVQAWSSKRAATAVQCFVRLLQARRTARKRCREVMQKIIDEETKYPYYYNTMTGAAQWHKPRILGVEDLDISTSASHASSGSLK
jgi:hypothetical protein